ncbi:MAG: DUF3429 domain-containing protein [Gammaproteobacteria bacterium]
MTAAPITRDLAAAGALPFVGCALFSLLGISSLPWLGSIEFIAATYGLAIASFMAGVHWGTALETRQMLPLNLFVSSNVLTLLGWFGVLLGTLSQALVVLVIVFVCLLMVDRRLHVAQVIDDAYWKTRRNVTVVVVVSLLITVSSGHLYA